MNDFCISTTFSRIIQFIISMHTNCYCVAPNGNRITRELIIYNKPKINRNNFISMRMRDRKSSWIAASCFVSFNFKCNNKQQISLILQQSPIDMIFYWNETHVQIKQQRHCLSFHFPNNENEQREKKTKTIHKQFTLRLIES